MQRISTTTKVVDKFGAGKHGFTNGNVVGGIPATDLEDAWFDNLQEEVANVVEGAGIVLNGGDKTQLKQAIQTMAAGRFIARRFFTASGTYTPTPGTRFIVALVQGGGGGGGGSAATGAGQCAAGAGGGGGGWSIRRIDTGFSGAAITVGAAGSAGLSGAAGGSGGSSSLGALLSATGGSGGSGGAAASASTVAANGAGSGGGGSGGDINGRGGFGSFAIYCANPVSGKGGFSFFGEGAGWLVGGFVGGSAATNYGGGGSGAAAAASNGAASGGSGFQGVVMIDEYA